MKIVPIATVAPDAVEALLDRAFGRERHAKTAYKLRDGATAIAGLSFAVVDEDRLLATIQCWPVALSGDDGSVTPMIMVGPVAVDPAIQRDGIGRRLMRHTLDAAAVSDRAGADALMLVGDPEYYARFFGFSADRTGKWRLPGPSEPRRLLALGTAVPGGAGDVIPRTA